MKIKTSELIGDALDWAACLASKQNYVNRETEYSTDGRRFQRGTTQPAGPHLSRDWSKGGPIIEQMRGIKLKSGRNPKAPCYAHIVGYNGVESWHQTGKTLLIAAMRCYVASKLGDEVDVPEELI